MQPFAFTDFSGGMNQRLSPRDIEDNEVVESKNMELNRKNSFRVRNGTTKLNSNALNGGKVTSIYHYRQSGGDNTVLAVSGTKLYRSTTGPGTYTDITSSFVFPNAVRWSWCVINDWAVGANGGTGGGETAVIKLTSPSASVAALATAPKFKFVVSWNSRLWGVPADQPSRLTWSGLGAPEDYASTGIVGSGSAEIGGKDGGHITGLHVWNERLWVFKRFKLYVVNPGSPNTDATQFTFPQINGQVGCVDHFSIQTVLNDVFFLSDEGLLSLQALLSSGGSLERAILSTNIPYLQDVDKSGIKVASVVYTNRNQYWLALPDPGGSDNVTTWVLDYSKYPNQISWTYFTNSSNGSGPVGASYGVVVESGNPKLYVGGYPNILRYADTGVFQDDLGNYDKVLITKAYSLGDSLTRKQFHRFLSEFGIETDPVIVRITYRFDLNDSKAKTYNWSFSGLSVGSRWGLNNWGTGVWAVNASEDTDIIKKILGEAGRRGQNIQFAFRNSTASGFSVKQIKFFASILTPWKVGDTDA